MPEAPLANSPLSGRTSLGGFQGKIVLARMKSEWYRVHNGFPSTHILKPVTSNYPTMIYDEALCMQLALKCGLTNYPVSIESFSGVDALIIERYDRQNGERIHQEDFNQVLGATGAEKYQEFGGKVNAKRIAQILKRFASEIDVREFATRLIFAIAIGNLDMHAKNISILHLPDESIKLAPTYDQVPLRHYNTDGRMSLAISGIYIHANITMKDIVSELLSWECQSFSDEDITIEFTKNCLTKYSEALSDVTANEKSYNGLKSDISLFISNLLQGKKIGSPKQ